MKSIFTTIASITLLTALAMAQSKPSYTVRDLGVLGTGTNSSGFGINQAGWVAGSTNLTPGGPQHAFLWYGGGPLKDLGTLGGTLCPICTSGGNGPNANGESAIGSSTANPDPL